MAAKRGSLHLNMSKMRDCALLDLRSSLSCVEALFSRSNPALFQTRREQNANKKEVRETSPADPGSPLAFIRKVGPALLQLGVVVPAVLSQRVSPHIHALRSRGVIPLLACLFPFLIGRSFHESELATLDGQELRLETRCDRLIVCLIISGADEESRAEKPSCQVAAVWGNGNARIRCSNVLKLGGVPFSYKRSTVRTLRPCRTGSSLGLSSSRRRLSRTCEKSAILRGNCS